MANRPMLVVCVGLAMSAVAGRVHAAPVVREYEGPAEVQPDADAPEVQTQPPTDVDAPDAPDDTTVDDTDEPVEGPAEPEPATVTEPALLDGPARAAPDEPRPTTTTDIAVDEAVTRAWMPRHRFIYRNFTAGRINPRGAVNETTIGYRRQIFRRDSLLFRDSYALFGAHAFVTPAFVRAGPVVEFQPIAALNFGVTYDVLGAFGNLNQMQSFSSPTSSWGPDDLKRNAKEGKHYATWGHLVTLSALLQAKVGPIVVRSATKGYWSKLDLRNDDRVYYDAALDLLLANGGWAISNETDLMYLFDGGLRLVVRHSVSHAFYRRDDFLPGEPVSQPNGPTSRLGPAVAYTFFDRPGVRFNRPTVFLLSQWWLRHRFRTGEQSNVGIPYLAVGFSFEGDIWPHRKDDKRRLARPRRRDKLGPPRPPTPVP